MNEPSLVMKWGINVSTKPIEYHYMVVGYCDNMCKSEFMLWIVMQRIILPGKS